MREFDIFCDSDHLLDAVLITVLRPIFIFESNICTLASSMSRSFILSYVMPMYSNIKLSFARFKVTQLADSSESIRKCFLSYGGQSFFSILFKYASRALMAYDFQVTSFYLLFLLFFLNCIILLSHSYFLLSSSFIRSLSSESSYK